MLVSRGVSIDEFFGLFLVLGNPTTAWRFMEDFDEFSS